jgi:hypothetical protein
MPRLYLTLLIACAGLAGADITEPQTKVVFPDTLEIGGKNLTCTGTTVRQLFGFEIYAIAHYAEDAAAPPAETSPEDALKSYIAAKAAKAFMIHFVFYADESNLRQYCSDALEKAGYKGAKKDMFLDVFAQDYKSGSIVKLIADADGNLSAEVDGTAKGKWADPDLVRAMWQIWMGEESVLKDRKSLVALHPGDTTKK